ncbi:hypothetical protein QQ045_011695 [Rhodiola kirilowii]
MESIIKQKSPRVSFSDTGRDGRSQKSASFEEGWANYSIVMLAEDYSSVQNWLKRQIEGQTIGHEYDSGDEQFATSVAAAAYAIELECKKERNQRHYELKIAQIDVIGRGAKSNTEEKMRSDETKVKERAKKMRSNRRAAYFLCF